MKQPKQLKKEETSLSPLQQKSEARSMPAVDTGIHFTIQKKENKTGLPDQLKSGIENLSGHAMDDVKVHYNSSQPAQLNAHAYAQGSQIHIAPGQEKHLPHEAWHVVQQKQGRVRPTKHLKSSVAINDDTGLEKEADVMGAKAENAVQLYSNSATEPDLKPSVKHHTGSVVQAVGWPSWEMLGGYNPRRYVPERIGGYSASTMKEIQDKEKAAKEKKFSERKQAIVTSVIEQNLKEGKNGWFELHEGQKQQYTQRVFNFLEKIRQTDMTTLMLAHQQVNDQALGTPEDKVKTLSKHIGHSDTEIGKLRHFDEDVVKTELNKKLQDEAESNKKLSSSKSSGKKVPLSMLQNKVRISSEIEAHKKKLASLKQLRIDGSPEIHKLDKLKQHKARMERELGFQKAQMGKKGVNIDFMNTSDVDSSGHEYVRAYMAIVAPNYDHKFKDFYLSDTKKLTYSANDKVMWVSFGTPLRSLSWFQKYAFAAATDKDPTNSVPLIRSFELPMSYFQKHIQHIGTEDPKSEKGKTVKSKKVSLPLKDMYGQEQFGDTYQSHVDVIDPYMMNVDVKYPNQFGLGRIMHGVELDAPEDLFSQTESLSKHISAGMQHEDLDQQIDEVNKQIAALEQEKADIQKTDLSKKTPLDIENEVKRLRGILHNKTIQAGYHVKKYIEQIDDAQDTSTVKLDIKIQALKDLMEEEFAPKVALKKELKRKLIAQKEEYSTSIKKIATGDSKVKSHISNTTQELETQVSKERLGDMASTAMADLLKQAIPGSFRTIALANDRKHEHVSGKEGQLLDYNTFTASLGLTPEGGQAEFHLLDDENTALHRKGNDGKWGSATPAHTESIYQKMRFFYHALDSQTKDMPQYSKQELAAVSPDQTDLTKDSHLAKIAEQAKKKTKGNPLADAYNATAIEAQLSVLLNANHFTPADVFGLPKNLESTRKDRHGNTIVKSAAETYFAQKQLSSATSLNFVAAQSATLLTHLNHKKYGVEFTKKLLENNYLKRDIQEILGKQAKGTIGINKPVDFNKAMIEEALTRMKNINSIKDEHLRLRMVYLFFHIMRPLAQFMDNDKSFAKENPVNYAGRKKKSKYASMPETNEFRDLPVNNREEQTDHFNYLNPRAKTFGIMSHRHQAQDDASMMPYDIHHSPTHHIPKKSNKMSEYMAEIDMPFVGGVSGTTRDQSQVLSHIFDAKTLKDHYWDFQLMNASFMIANGYHSFFETIYVAARYDTSQKGELILREFANMKNRKKYGKYNAYTTILKIIDAKSDILDGFEKWYAAKVQKEEEDKLDLTSKIKMVKGSTTVPSGTTITPVSSIPSKSQTATGSSSKKGDINHEYLYEDNDIYTIINLLIAEHHLNNVHVIPPVDNIVSSQLRQRLQEEAAGRIDVARKVLIPYNKGNYHWIGILLDITANQAQVNAYVMDPAQNTNAYVNDPAISNEIIHVYANAAIQAASHLIQQDGSSCGVLTVNNLIALARNQGLQQDVPVLAGAQAERQAHVTLMDRERPGDYFAHKQKFNQYSFSYFDVQAYLEGDGKNRMTLEESQLTLKIVQQFGQYPEKTGLSDAFSKLAQGKTLSEALPAIRHEMNTILVRLKQGQEAKAKDAFLDIARKLFVVKADSLDRLASFDTLAVNNVTLLENVGASIKKGTQEKGLSGVLSKLEKSKKSKEEVIEALKKQFPK